MSEPSKEAAVQPTAAGAETSEVRNARDNLESERAIEADEQRRSARAKRFETWPSGIWVSKRTVGLQVGDLEAARKVWMRCLDTDPSLMVASGLLLCINAAESRFRIGRITNGFLEGQSAAAAGPQRGGTIDRRPWAAWLDCVDMLLALTVPLHIAQLLGKPEAELVALAGDCAVIVGTQGDSFIHHSGKDRGIAAAANALAVGLAIAAITCPDGVTYREMRWCGTCFATDRIA